jgi:hypothetical protein
MATGEPGGGFNMNTLNIQENREQYLLSNWNDNTGNGFSWYQGYTSDVIALLDLLTVSPSARIKLPIIAARIKKDRLKIEVAKADSATAFYLLMQKGEVKCLPNDVYEINRELIDYLIDNAISFEII